LKKLYILREKSTKIKEKIVARAIQYRQAIIHSIVEKLEHTYDLAAIAYKRMNCTHQKMNTIFTAWKAVN
jgi:hypothetical protein